VKCRVLRSFHAGNGWAIAPVSVATTPHHPFLIDHPHRSKYFDAALKHITSRQEVWLAKGGELLDGFLKTDQAG
jgi:hypothetical protein